eukprot:363691-Chlamydomonas_euryale.AAC.5
MQRFFKEHADGGGGSTVVACFVSHRHTQFGPLPVNLTRGCAVRARGYDAPAGAHPRRSATHMPRPHT